MKFAQDFKERVMKAYPDHPEICSCLENEDYELLGRYLSAGANSGSISIKRVLEAKTLDELKEYALLLQERVRLNNIWRTAKAIEQNGGIFDIF